MTTVVAGYDATHSNINRLPKGQAAGYTTGSLDIRWTSSDWQSHPGAVRICQDAGATDETADILDIEFHAATIQEASRWYRNALTNWENAVRPGQRKPAFYISEYQLHSLVNQLIGDGVKSGPYLWVANWNYSESSAADRVSNSGGPFPLIGLQYRDAGAYDMSVFSQDWLANVSTKDKPPSPPVPRQKNRRRGMYYLHAKDTGRVFLAIPNPAGIGQWCAVYINNSSDFVADLPTFGFTTEAEIHTQYVDLPGITEAETPL